MSSRTFWTRITLRARSISGTRSQKSLSSEVRSYKPVLASSALIASMKQPCQSCDWTHLLTKLCCSAGYQFVVQFLRYFLAPIYELHEVREIGSQEILVKWSWTMNFWWNRYLPSKFFWDPRLAFTGISILGYNPDTGRNLHHQICFSEKLAGLLLLLTNFRAHYLSHTGTSSSLLCQLFPLRPVMKSIVAHATFVKLELVCRKVEQTCGCLGLNSRPGVLQFGRLSFCIWPNAECFCATQSIHT